MARADDQYAAVIVGGGPAGLAASIALARNGIRTLLLERRKLPYAKVCGEGLMPVGLRALEKLGVDLLASADGAAGSPFRGVGYYDESSGTIARAQFAEGPGLGLPRRELAARLYAAAGRYERTAGCVGATAAAPGSPGSTPGMLAIRDGVLCDRLRREADGFWSVRADGIGTVRSRLLIGADGIHSFVRRAASLDRDALRNDPRRWGARWHFPIAPWTDGFVEVHLLGLRPGVECYITPVGQRETGLAFLWDREIFRPGGGEDLLASLLAVFPNVSRRVAGLAPLPDGGAIGPLMHRARSVVGPGVLLIGDAAGYLDAATGEGLSLAFEQALVLEERIVPALRGAGAGAAANVDAGTKTNPAPDRELARALEAYRRRHRRITANYYLTTRLVLWLGRRPVWLRRVVAGLRTSPRFFQHVLSVNMGTRRLVVGSPLFALWRFLRGAIFASGASETGTDPSPGAHRAV